ncbi:hypothetical protein BJ508DRAFT_315772 [Ascobolus immersus RN42]|uniref:Uncharacterized protein n=1 Tax=Ascobolus immersus RN42 TaxID=1160509 RepID=A0A3N4HNP7_ASCIM|nr:hypothetical protein BJ508DRAFT_315772 [Ascobolus immersus RN42]
MQIGVYSEDFVWDPGTEAPASHSAVVMVPYGRFDACILEICVSTNKFVIPETLKRGYADTSRYFRLSYPPLFSEWLQSVGTVIKIRSADGTLKFLLSQAYIPGISMTSEAQPQQTMPSKLDISTGALDVLEDFRTLALDTATIKPSQTFILSLPNELFYKIFSNILSKTDTEKAHNSFRVRPLASRQSTNLALVCRRFQLVAESFNFRRISLKDNDDVLYLLRLNDQDRRKPLIRQLTVEFRVVFHRADDTLKLLEKLMSNLRTWDPDAARRDIRIKLSVEGHPSNGPFGIPEDWEEQILNVCRNGLGDPEINDLEDIRIASASGNQDIVIKLEVVALKEDLGCYNMEEYEEIQLEGRERDGGYLWCWKAGNPEWVDRLLSLSAKAGVSIPKWNTTSLTTEGGRSYYEQEDIEYDEDYFCQCGGCCPCSAGPPCGKKKCNSWDY